MTSLSAAVQAKAIRYVVEGRIRPEVIGSPIESYLTFSESDHDLRYRTVVGPSWSMCTCPATVACCHRFGAELLSTLRRHDPIRYHHVMARILDAAARADNPIDPEELYGA